MVPSPYYILNTAELPHGGIPPGLDPAQVSGTQWSASPYGLTPVTSTRLPTDGIGGAVQQHTDRPVVERQAVIAGTSIVDKIVPNKVVRATAVVVTFNGTRFTGATAVAFGGNAGTAITVVSDTQLRVTTPVASVAGPVNITVTTPSGTSPPHQLFSFT
jgi:hypothetical protein